MNNESKVLAAQDSQPQWFGHPRGLFYLFFAELWERFSFYGMRALLVLYMVKDLYESIEGNKEIAYGIYAAYGALVYATPVLGGFIADRLIGYRKSIMLGAVLMALGHFTMAIQHEVFFFGALGLLIVGNGFFKPNISTMVGTLYGKGDPKRDAGFTIFYMGINIGAWASPLLCGWLGATYGWHYGFGAAGVGMLVGLLVFRRGLKRDELGDRGHQPKRFVESKFGGFNIDKWVYLGAFLSVPLFALMVFGNDFQFMKTGLMNIIMLVLFIGILIYIIYICVIVSKVDRQRIFVILAITFFMTAFWSFFEQAGSSLTLFAEENVNLVLLNASQTNSINPGYIIFLAIPFSWMWVKLSAMRRNPITPIKFALGIGQLGLGFLIFGYSAQFMDDAGKVPMSFLVIGWLVITTGELFSSPIGLSKVTELSVPKFVAFFMGVYFLAATFGHHLAGAIAKLTVKTGESYEGFIGSIITSVTGFVNGTTDSSVAGVQTLASYTSVFTLIGLVAFGFALLALISSPLLKKWMHGIH